MHVTQLHPLLVRTCSDALVIEDLEYNHTSLTLTCTTSGRPVHSITWLKDDTAVGTEFCQKQTITNALTATYQHTLIGGDIASLVGSFTCMAVDTEGNSISSTRILNGTIVTSDKGPSEKGTTSQQRTMWLIPRCPLFGGSTVLILCIKSMRPIQISN